MKKNILWGILFILVALTLILHSLGIDFGIFNAIPLWKIILSLTLTIFIIQQLIKKKFANVFFPLIFIVMIFEKEIALALGLATGNITSVWVFLLIALLLTIGTALITKDCFTFTIKFANDERVYTGKEAKKMYKEMRNATSVYYVDCSEKIDQEFEVNLGKADIFFSNTELYEGNGKIKVENNLGKITIHVPSDWTVICEIENSLGIVHTLKPAPNQSENKKITVTGENNLGKIEFIKEN